MPHLLRKPFGAHGKVHEITPASAGWRFVGFSLYRLRPGETAAEVTGDREIILVLVEGKARLTGAGRDWGLLGDRMDVFEKAPPHCLYLPDRADWTATAKTDCTLAVCSAPGAGRPAEDLAGRGYESEERWGSLRIRAGDATVPSEQGRYHDYCEAIATLAVLDAARVSAREAARWRSPDADAARLPAHSAATEGALRTAAA